MTRETWVISDTHFSHENILNFTDMNGNRIRPEFNSVKEMDEVIIENWNSVVKKGDVVYHLGDFGFNREEIGKIINRLNGKKKLIVGNHDDIKFLSSGNWFSKILLQRKMSDMGLYMTHLPIHPSSTYDLKIDMQMMNVHGHIHEKDPPTIDHFNVSVERINYTPINIEDIRIR